MSCYNRDKFCFMRLPTAGVVIGWISAVISFLQSVVYIVGLVILDRMVKNIDSRRIVDGTLAGIMALGLSVVVSVNLAISLLDFVSSIMLIFGVKRNSHLMLLPWLINNCLSVALKIIAVIVCLSTRLEQKDVIIAVVLLIMTGIQCWVWMGICLLFQSIRASRDQVVENKTQNAGSINYELFNNPACVGGQSTIKLEEAP